MNAFARGLFQLLIGWVRSLTALWDGDWTRLDSFFAWVTGHWMGLVLPLVLIGTAADLLIWLLRWRPDIAWRSRWKRLRNFSVRGFLHEVRFHRGYDQDNTQIMEAARPIREPAPAEAPEPPMQESFRPVDVLEEREQLEADLGVTRPTRLLDTPVPAEDIAPERRRRSDKYRMGLLGAVRHVRERFRDEEEDEFEPDVLPPIMSKEEAFRAPVYPGGQRGRNAAQPGGEDR